MDFIVKMIPIANGCLMVYFINKFNCYQVMKQGDIRIRCPPMGRIEPLCH